jgi:hypothetical protein
VHDARYDPDEMTAYDLPAARSIPVQVRVAATGRGDHPTIVAADYDLRTLPEREAAAVAALALRCDSLAEQLAVAARQIGALEERERAHAAAIERLADAVQVLILRGGV